MIFSLLLFFCQAHRSPSRSRWRRLSVLGKKCIFLSNSYPRLFSPFPLLLIPWPHVTIRGKWKRISSEYFLSNSIAGDFLPTIILLSGPPVAQQLKIQKTVRKIVHVGEDVKIVCPSPSLSGRRAGRQLTTPGWKFYTQFNQTLQWYIFHNTNSRMPYSHNTFCHQLYL